MDVVARLAGRARALTPSPIRELVPLMRLPGMISFGGGYPNPETFAFAALRAEFKVGGGLALSGDAMDGACQYGPTGGQPGLVPKLMEWHCAKDGVSLNPEQLIVLNGAQEGLHIMAYLFLEPDDSVAISEPAYPGALGAFRAFTTKFLPVPVDSGGTITIALENMLRTCLEKGGRLPKFIYENPSGHNPAGTTLTMERREHLLAIASRFDLIILEDDPYQLLRLEGQAPAPSLQSLDRDGRVVRLDSFSKIFAPGMRIGYASGPESILKYFHLYKQGTNLHTSSLIQALLAGFLEARGVPAFRSLIAANCELYRRNRDAMVAAAGRHLPGDVTCTVPADGMFLWFRLPAGFDASRMVAKDGRDLGILMVPGAAFSTTGGLGNHMRASFSMVSIEQIEEGMKRFAVMIDRERQRLSS
ncbi:PLP-dependent aminotransferase family protein [bacterium]|nr:PLP-dependent aminotransferase family protein [candidate division CSSED10-310 bacterium]